MENEEIKQQIITVLEKVRPFINRDGGDIEFVDYKDGIAYVRMLGACEDCAYIDNTLQEGIAIIIMEEVPGVTKVLNVNADFKID